MSHIEDSLKFLDPPRWAAREAGHAFGKRYHVHLGCVDNFIAFSVDEVLSWVESFPYDCDYYFNVYDEQSIYVPTKTTINVKVERVFNEVLVQDFGNE